MGVEPNLDFVRLVTEVSQAGRALGLDELVVLNALWLERQMDTPQAAELIQKLDAEARAVIARLVEAGLVEARGQRRGRMYHLSARTYQRLGAKAAYVRQRGFEPLQQAQMVLQFVEKHGRITRREAAELAQLSPDQATRLLARLVRENKLAMHGSRKSAWYGDQRPRIPNTRAYKI
jgi:ATP-dependent DNA helicase RecG